MITSPDDGDGNETINTVLVIRTERGCYSTLHPDAVLELINRAKKVGGRVLSDSVEINSNIQSSSSIKPVNLIKFIALVNALGMGFYPYKLVRYQFDYRYGGPEEGGWYYSVLSSGTEIDQKEYDEITNHNWDLYDHQKDFVVRQDFYVGESDTNHINHHYC